MNIEAPKGKYIVAVSGGVDSMTLLNMLSKLPDLELIVAHVDHGIRPDSAQDRVFVQQTAASYGFPFEYCELSLGANASEDQARRGRYAFLQQQRDAHRAHGIITAHHQDDVIETAIINMARGTHFRGLYALRSRSDVVRPLLDYTKQEILDYAREHDVQWREDYTNADDIYMRNRIRKRLSEHMSTEQRHQLLDLIETLEKQGQQIDVVSREILDALMRDGEIDRRAFTGLPYRVACQILVTYLRKESVAFDKKGIELAVTQLKTKPVGTIVMLQGARRLELSPSTIRLQPARSV